MPDTLHNLGASLIGTGFAEFATLPICTIKTNYQNSGSQSISKTAKMIFQNSGIRGFYAASAPAIIGQMISTSSKYTMYRYLNGNPDYPIKNRFLNGMTAGIMSSLMTHPLDVVKIHWQMKTPITPEFKKIGPFLLYRGYSKTFAKIAISSSMFFPIYDNVKERVDNHIIASMTSGVISATIMHPVDYLKTRHMAGLPLYQGFNPLIYYKGLTLNLMRIVPHFMITMSIIEFCNKNLTLLKN
jgi:hypothetical protein